MKKKYSHWNYRVLRHVTGDTHYRIHEVYYDKKGIPKAWSAEPDVPHGETVIDLFGDLSLMQEAYSKPILSVVSDGKKVERLVVAHDQRRV